jgi:hypothetical protein
MAITPAGFSFLIFQDERKGCSVYSNVATWRHCLDRHFIVCYNLYGHLSTYDIVPDNCPLVKG